MFVSVLIFACSAIHKRLSHASIALNLNELTGQQRYVYQRALASRWLFEERFNAPWVTWPVLTKHNTAANSLHLPEIVAQHIFTDLQARHLLVPAVAEGNHVVYTWNLSDEAAWREVSEIPSRYKRLVSWLRKNLGAFVKWIVTLIAGGLIGAYIDRYFKH